LDTYSGGWIAARAATIQFTPRKVILFTPASSDDIFAWPRLDSGALDISSDAFRLMYHHPGIEGLHALRDSIGFIAKARLPIGSDGRNRPSLFPFATVTGRNAHARTPFNAHARMRSFIAFSL